MYSVEFRTPFLPNQDIPIADAFVNYHRGSWQDNWQSFYDEPGSSGKKEAGLTYHGATPLPILPGVRTLLCQFRLSEHHFTQPERFACDYTIVADRVGVQAGRVYLAVERFVGVPVK